ncbi:hypothetical protein Golob_024570 [Gossypium lobatum]|uniref:Uncharacterized protein n=1 Tax=Gossypium lobatum TaxID=34289 RepID=A0A7J8NIX0_9ROSI|nr:hypothetical protein [Gossypium lobatum]
MSKSILKLHLKNRIIDCVQGLLSEILGEHIPTVFAAKAFACV